MTYFANLSEEQVAAAHALAERMKAVLLPIEGVKFRGTIEMEAAAEVIDALLLSASADETILGLAKVLQYIGLIEAFRQLAGGEWAWPMPVVTRDD